MAKRKPVQKRQKRKYTKVERYPNGKRRYRDGLGRITSEEHYKAYREILKTGVTDRKTGKKIKVNKVQATNLIYDQKIKRSATGEKNLNQLEADIDDYFKKNPKLRIKITLPNGKVISSTGKAANKMFYSQLKKVWRELRATTGNSRPYPAFIAYTKESKPGNQTPDLVEFDLRDFTTNEGDELFDDEEENE